MKLTAQTLENLGYEVILPNPREGEVNYNSLSDSERATLKSTLIQEHLDQINESDAILVFNEDKKGIAGYVGGNTLMEMAFAYAQKIEIFLLKPSLEMSYTDEILGMLPIIIDGDINKIDTYFKQLPTVLVSSESPIKLSAISRGMRRAGIRTQILAQPTNSKVAEQPRSIDETYRGALNRHEMLLQETASEKPTYLATVESGNHSAHTAHNVFGCEVVIIEKVGAQRKIGISLGLELPTKMTDMVPSKYPDLGILVQKEYGSKLKDPVHFIANGKTNRRKFVEEAVFNVAVQLSTD